MRLDTLTIKKLMGSKGMTGVELARLTGVTRQTISNILGRGTCSVTSAVKIADALNVDIEEIVKEG